MGKEGKHGQADCHQSASHHQAGAIRRRWYVVLVGRLGGTKSWVQRVTIDGKRREIGLGAYHLVGLAKARPTQGPLPHAPSRTDDREEPRSQS